MLRRRWHLVFLASAGCSSILHSALAFSTLGPRRLALYRARNSPFQHPSIDRDLNSAFPLFHPRRPLRLEQASNDDEGENHRREDQRSGQLVLFTVPLAWGTFEPAVRYVYDVQPDIPPFIFQFVYYLVAATSLLVALAVASKNNRETETTMTGDETKLISSLPTSTTMNDTVSGFLGANTLPVQGGLELGTYLFLGNGLQVVGLKTVPSDRAAFLLQLTTIFVPLVQSLFAGNLKIVPLKTWVACLVALTGVACIGFDGGPASEASIMAGASNGMKFTIGDLYIMLGALFYTFHCIRLEGYAKSTSAVKLAAAKASTEAWWCAMVVVACVVAATTMSDRSFAVVEVARSSGENILEYTQVLVASVVDGTVTSEQLYQLGAATVWIGVVTIAYTIYAQSYGQSRVPPATANLIYTIQPFFTAVIAFLLLGERLGTFGYLGGILVGAAVLLVIEEAEYQ